MTTKAEKSSQTRAQIIEAARKLFENEGYAGAALADIVRNAEVTTGAVYHHFGDKKGLFTAVAEELEKEILAHVSRKIADIADEWERLEQGITNTLEICARPDIQRIVFKEAPTVVGQHEWRQIEMNYAFGMMLHAVRALSLKNLTIKVAPELLARIMLGTVIEAAHVVADSDNRTAALSEARETVMTMLRSIKSEPGKQ